MPNVTGAFVALLERYAITPIEPGLCRPAVASVVVTVQVAGAAEPDVHARAFSCVGAVPLTSSCTRIGTPGLATTPATRTSGAISTSPLVPASFVIAR